MNDRAPVTPPNLNGQIPIPPKVYVYEIYVRAPNQSGQMPIARVNATDINRAMLMFLATFPDFRELREIRMVRVESMILTPN